MHLLVWNQGFSLMLFSAKELKNHVIYTYTSVCIENVCTSGEDGLPTCWGLLAQQMLRVRLVASHSLSLSPRCQAPTSQVENQAHTRTDSSWRAALVRSSSCPSSHSCQLRPQRCGAVGEGRRGELPTMACGNMETNWERKDTCTCTNCTRTGMRLVLG